jgi:hypothetical protein
MGGTHGAKVATDTSARFEDGDTDRLQVEPPKLSILDIIRVIYDILILASTDPIFSTSSTINYTNRTGMTPG